MTRPFAYGFGFIYVVLGVIGFVWTGFDGWVEADGSMLLLFELNPTHNLAHLAVGAVLMWAGTETSPADRVAVAVVGLLYLGLGIAGFWLTGAPDYNVLAINTADNWLHIVSGLLGVAAAAVPAPSRRDARVP